MENIACSPSMFAMSILRHSRWCWRLSATVCGFSSSHNFSCSSLTTSMLHSADSQLLTVRQRIEPGATASLLLRMDRLLLNPKRSMQPIPSVVDRQFVVSKVAMTAREDRISKELFWYREELLKKIKATWREVSLISYARRRPKSLLIEHSIVQVGTMRTGSISLRGLRLTKPMLDVLRIDDVDIRLSLETPVQSKADSGPDGAGAGAGSKVGNRTSATRFSARSNERQTLVLKIANHSGKHSLSYSPELLPESRLDHICNKIP